MRIYKYLPLLAIPMALFLLMPKPTLAFTGTGTGTSGDPFIITTCDQLQEMNDDLTATYQLSTDIDCLATFGWNGGLGFVPIGENSPYFSGTLDGNGKKIIDLFINRPGSSFYLGLFSQNTTGSVIRNLGLQDVNITGGQYVGALVGYNHATITNSYSSGTVQGTYVVGGLTGYNASSITDSYSTTEVENSSSYTGGLSGYNAGTVTRSHSSSSGNIIGTDYTGGLIGKNDGTITSSYSNSSVSTTGPYTGGLNGYNTHIITGSYSTGSVAGTDNYIGGLVGINVGPISTSYESGAVNGSGTSDWVGGLIGVNASNVTDNYATGAVTGDTRVGGFVGENDNSGTTITNSYSTGLVTGNSSFGGFVGVQDTGTHTTNSFWDVDTSGQGSGCGNGTCTVTGDTTSLMKTGSTFTAAGWNFTTLWNIDGFTNSGYPFLNPRAAITSAKIISSTSFRIIFSNPVDWSISDFTNLDIGGARSISSIAETAPSSTVTVTFNGSAAPGDATGTVDVAAMTDDGSGHAFAGQTGRVLSDGQAPTTQNTVLTLDKTVPVSSTVTIGSSGDITNQVWLVPNGTISFVVGPTKTKTANGTSTTIIAPSVIGTYYIYVIDAAGNISSQSMFSVTTAAAASSGSGTSSPTIALTAPSGTIAAGTSVAVDWSISGQVIQSIAISYSTDGGADFTAIAENIQINGPYFWQVPTALVGSIILHVDGREFSGSNIASNEIQLTVLAPSAVLPVPHPVAQLPGVTRDSQGRLIAPLTSQTGPSPLTLLQEPISQVLPGEFIRGYGFSTVYYISGNMTRHPFWTPVTYFTWASSYDQIIWVTDATLPTLTLSTPVLPKPGVVLVKINSVSKTYEVELTADGSYLLHWLINQDVATGRYGANWADYVLDLDPTIFLDYKLGSDQTNITAQDTSMMKTRQQLAALING